ncbi:MAG: hypothetical protein K0R06_1706 [Clostridium sp.]|jgi:hypothetical protein|nr:hypothetical protein [Clostridium sp.]
MIIIGLIIIHTKNELSHNVYLHSETAFSNFTTKNMIYKIMYF